MSKSKFTVAQVREALEAVVAQSPDRVDRRSESDELSCRYTEHGKCSCLAAEVMHRLGFSLHRLKTMDRAAGGTPISLRSSGLSYKFTPLAFEMLCHIQQRNDTGHRWDQILRDTLSFDNCHTMWERHRQAQRPWLAETEPLK
jgi:hypothetical protein